MNNPSVRLIASYLPQFYPIPENDLWWGEGFTEWTNVRKAVPLFEGHLQPRVPADLGYYDLREKDVRIAQANMARDAGIEGFCYWHYWFGNGKRLLERVFDEVVNSGEPDFPFCLGWANETWSGVWHGAKNRILMEQTYPGLEDYQQHYQYLSKAFHDERYIKVNGKPLFLVYKPDQLPNTKQFIEYWQELAIKDGLPGIYFVAQTIYAADGPKYLNANFDAVNPVRLYDYERNTLNKLQRGIKHLLEVTRIYEYKDAMKHFVGMEESEIDYIPTIIPNWDHSPRSGKKGYILHNSTPELFSEHVSAALDIIKHKPPQHRIAFIKSWNEWGESNYLEPDIVHGYKYLSVIKNSLQKIS